jgi:RHS repeat-associated protein
MSTTLEQSQYGFDRDSRRAWQRRPLTSLQDQSYQYDALSQVNAAARGSLNLNATAISGIPSLEESWNYDPTGNWRGYHAAANGSSTLDQQRVHDRGNRLTQIEDNPHNLILDRSGRMRQTAPDAAGDWDGKLELTWDAWSRITGVKNNGEVAGEYTYDGLFRRITREVDEETLHSYYNNQWRPVEERKDAETTASLSYLWGARHRDDLVRRDRAVGGTTLNETRYILMDYFNPAAITDESGEVTERYAFSAFGVRTILNPDYTVKTDGSECGMEFGFQGQFLEVESGLMNYGYRYYSPHLGRWTCKDPIAEKGGMNLYKMSDNTPLNLVDWLGLDPVKCEDSAIEAEQKRMGEMYRGQAIEDDLEYGGMICCRCGVVSSTVAVLESQNGQSNVAPHIAAPCPEGKSSVGWWHTHGGPRKKGPGKREDREPTVPWDPDVDQDDLDRLDSVSDFDKGYSESMGMSGSLTNPSGEFKRF